MTGVCEDKAVEDRPYDKERLKHLIHYVIWKVGARPDFGATKLYKAAWFSDARCFVLFGQSVTGAQYVREKHGPIPKYGIAIRQELADLGCIQQWKSGNSWRFNALVPAKPDWFTPKERETIDYWAKHIAEGHTAASISDQSHDLGWEIAQMGEPLPFHSVLADRIRDPNGAQMAWAKQRARELRLP